MSKGKIIYMVVPCYNEEEVLDETTKQLSDKLQKLIDAGEISEKSRILYVNDGSKDQTWPIICRLHEEYTLVSGLNLSRNRGHQNAVLAGLMSAIAVIGAKLSNNQQKTDQAWDWLKRIWLAWAVINGIGAFIAYVAPLFSGLATLTP